MFRVSGSGFRVATKVIKKVRKVLNTYTPLKVPITLLTSERRGYSEGLAFRLWAGCF